MANSGPIAVIIPAYNCARYIREALYSLEQQTLQPALVVVTDDGSTDETARLVEHYRQQSNIHIKLIRQANRGIAAARNAAVEHCDQNYIALLDGDDAYYPRFLEKAVTALARHDDLVICFTDRDVVDDKNNILRRDLDEPKFRALDSQPLGDNVFLIAEDPFTSLVSGNVIPIGNSILKKETFYEVGGFDPDLRYVEDQSFLLNLIRLGHFGFIDEPLGIWRRHSTNTSGAWNTFRMNWYQNMAIEKLLSVNGTMPLDEIQLSAVLQMKKTLPSRLLYTAAEAGELAYPRLLAQYAFREDISWPRLLKYTLRFCWRYVTTRR